MQLFFQEGDRQALQVVDKNVVEIDDELSLQVKQQVVFDAEIRRRLRQRVEQAHELLAKAARPSRAKA